MCKNLSVNVVKICKYYLNRLLFSPELPYAFQMRKVGETRNLSVLLFGVLGGLALGVLARLWMRTISTEPEFSWSGSIFIVGLFVIFGISQSIVYILRRKIKGRKPISLVRAIGGFFSLSIFLGAGALMFPTVAMGSIAVWREKLGNRVRVLLVVLSLIVPLIISKDIISDFGWKFSSVGKILLFIFIYGVVIVAIRPTVSEFKDPSYIAKPITRRKKILVVIGILLVPILFLFLTIGVPFT